uniref:Uncharacterized protein n=1 Tax=Aegilops tauschii subsp. strangulata TaxID=200361 RepID=A0A453F8H8_AEGTS
HSHSSARQHIWLACIGRDNRCALFPPISKSQSFVLTRLNPSSEFDNIFSRMKITIFC